MSHPVPTVGRIVHYKMPAIYADQVNRRRQDAVEKQHWHQALRSGAQVHQGNTVKAGDVFAALIVQVWGGTPDSAVNLQVFLDGTDSFWATSAHVGERDGDFAWPASAPRPTVVLNEREGAA